MITYDEFVKRIPEWVEKAHSNAKEKGFHDKPLSEIELKNLIASELFEGFEMLRDGWKVDEVRVYSRDRHFVFEENTHNLWVRGEEFDGLGVPIISKKYGKCRAVVKYGKHKLEGIPIELADVLIRCFDVLGLISDCFINIPHGSDYSYNEYMGDIISTLYDLDTDFDLSYRISFIITVTYKFCQHHNINIAQWIDAKMAYNRTRPRKHGKEF